MQGIYKEPVGRAEMRCYPKTRKPPSLPWSRSQELGLIAKPGGDSGTTAEKGLPCSLTRATDEAGSVLYQLLEQLFLGLLDPRPPWRNLKLSPTTIARSRRLSLFLRPFNFALVPPRPPQHLSET